MSDFRRNSRYVGFMKTVLLISAAIFLSACSTVGAGTQVIKTTGKVAATSGKIIYKTGAATGKAVMDAGRGTATAINKTTNTEVVQGVTRAPTAQNVDRVGDKGSFGEVMLTPLSDINLRKQRIPEKLTALQTPYDVVRDQSCRALVADIQQWDAILGPDIDSAIYESRDVKDKRQTRETTLDVAEAGIGSFIPFRGLVRAATGATKHENEIRRQYRKGVARRAYLRGLAAAQKC